jgi:predicted P-loop ATPase
MSALSRAEAAALKAFITRTEEQYRPPWGRKEVSEPRQCVFIGTTNKPAYLRDETGGRRFWPVKVGKVKLEALERDRDQLFAEAVCLFQSNGRWWPDAAFEREHIQPEQDARFEADAWEDVITDYLIGRDRVSVGQVAKEALSIDTPKQDRVAQNRIIAVLDGLRWQRVRDSQGRGYVRPPMTHDAQ